MSENVSAKLNKYLPRPVSQLIREISGKADETGNRIFLVGGVVRDLFLNRPNLDIDLVIEGDAIKLALWFSEKKQLKFVVHKKFGTAKLKFNEFSIDLITARSEHYDKPGALPTVTPGNITDDLARRDFSMNAIAIQLNEACFGNLLDPYRGKEDIAEKLIRILHTRSFIDDATRIFRAIRYEQRLDFNLEEDTEHLAKRDIEMVDTISPDRIKHELELFLTEDYPEKILHRAQEIGLLVKIAAGLKGDSWIINKYKLARRYTTKNQLPSVYLCLLIYRLSDDELENLLARFNFTKKQVEQIRQTVELKNKIDKLARDNLKNWDIYSLLNAYNNVAVLVNMLATESVLVKDRAQLYLSRLINIRPRLTGDDLVAMGISGPEVGEILNHLLKSKINEKLDTKSAEISLVQRLITKSNT